MDEKGWSSQRVPQASGSSRRNLSVGGFSPFYSWRTLPSKWEDAERWISSPVAGNVAGKSLQSIPQRRWKSKSGPIVEPPAVVTYNPSYSPAVARNFMVRSAFSNGYGGQSHIPSNPVGNEEQFACQPRWSDILIESSSPSSRDDSHGDKEVKDARDMATHMSYSQYEGTDFSPKGKSSCSSSSCPTLLSVNELQSDHVSKLEIRDVGVDKGTTVIWWSNGHEVEKPIKRASPDLVPLNRNAMDVGASSLDIAEAAINVSKLQKEEARIIAWENLQKAKAEAAIHKLEVELEKKRSSTMEDILDKLRKAQIKASKMRSSLSVNQTNQVPRTYFELLSFRKHVGPGSLRRCFTCSTQSTFH